MKHRRLFSILAASSIVAACTSIAPDVETASTDAHQPDVTAEQDQSFEPGKKFPYTAQTFLDCDAYLTSRETDGYCSDDVPPDWQSFEFDGERYFHIPLAASLPTADLPQVDVAGSANEYSGD